MKNQQTITRGATRTAPTGLTALARRKFTGVIALLLIAAAFGGQAWAITGGQPDGNRHPNVGALVVYNPAIDEIHTISGTLIHPRVVLTAGHVVGFFESGTLTLLGVSFDEDVNLEDPRTWLPVCGMAKAFTAFNADPKGSDIGALILEHPVTSIAPAPLPSIGFLDNLWLAGKLQAGRDATRFTVVGYGMILNWPPPEPFWQDPPTRNMALSGFQAMNGGWLFLNQNQALGYGGTARGDSGGPTFWTDPQTKQQFLVAVTSWGDAKFVATGIAYRIDTAQSLQFIQDVIVGLGE